ncbi:MAG: 1-acyl-sn-glycerol-3-phosphate acyltransferase [Desulfomonilaceae bacterium]
MTDCNKRNMVSEFLSDGRFRHLDTVLDQEPPWILRSAIRLLSARVRIDDYVVAKLRDLAENNAIVYALKFRTTYDLHFLRMRFADLGLPVPNFIFDASAKTAVSFSKIFRVWKTKLSTVLKKRQDRHYDENILKQILNAGDGAALFLVDEKTSRRRYLRPESDPVQLILDLQPRLAKSIAIVPMMILYDRAPRSAIRPFWETFLGNPDRPGLIRRILIAMRHWTIPELLVGEPVYAIAQFEEFGATKSGENLPFEVRQQLIDSINSRIRVNRGPEKLTRTEIKELVLQDSRVQRAVRESAQNKGVPETKIRKKAESYVDEIAGDPHLQIHHLLFYVLKWMFKRVFAGIDLKESDFATIKQLNTQESLIIVPCHKSHFDYLLMGFFCFINQMAVPYFAAGKNLSFWPLGPLLRNGGAFFLRRTFRGLDLYTHVFAAYVKVLVKEKANIIFYIEGGRSRTGKLLLPKLGLLSFLLQTIEEGAVEDLIFVPAFIGYDQIPEENSYLRELAGRDKQKESLFSIIRAREILRKSFGKVYLRFDKAMSFREFSKKWGLEWQPGKTTFRENRKFVNDFAFQIMYGILRAGVVTPIELLAAGLVYSGHTKIPHDVLMYAVQNHNRALRRRGFEVSESLSKLENVVETALGLLKFRGFVEIEADELTGGNCYLVNEQKRANLQFYKNSLVNYLWPESLLASALIANGSGATELTQVIQDDFSFLKELMSLEIIVDPLGQNGEILDSTFQWFLENGWLRHSGQDTASPSELEVFRGILGDILEIYYLVLAAAESLKSGGINQKDFAKHLFSIAEALYTGDLKRPLPSIPMALVGNALSRFAQMGILDYNHSRKYIKQVVDPVRLRNTKNSLAKALKGRITSLDASA